MDLNKEIMNEGTIDYIIHAAGGANPRLYSSKPVEVIEPNVIGTYNLLEYARKHGNKGFLIFSSGDVYGKVDEPENISEETVGKVDQLDIHSCYSESKRMAETIAVSYFREYGIPIKILRIGHTYGPTMDIKNDPRVFASFLKCVLEKRNIEMLSDGLTKRPFCYLADAVAAYFTVLFKGDAGEAYNICNTGEFISMRELANIVLTLEKEKKLKVVYLGREYEDGYVYVNSGNVYDFTLNELQNYESYLKTSAGYKGKVTLYAKISCKYIYYCTEKEAQSIAQINICQRQLFDLD